MSIGFFLGVANSYAPTHTAEAARLVGCINNALASNGHPKYVDATPHLPEHGMGRCSLDHFGAGGLSRFFAFARQHDVHRAFEASGERDVFLPIRFDAPLLVPLRKSNWFPRQAKVGSLYAMLDALFELAPLLGIPIENDDVNELVAALIDEMQPLHANDDADAIMLEDLRMAWLLHHEAANLAIEYNVALALGP